MGCNGGAYGLQQIPPEVGCCARKHRLVHSVGVCGDPLREGTTKRQSDKVETRNANCVERGKNIFGQLLDCHRARWAVRCFGSAVATMVNRDHSVVMGKYRNLLGPGVAGGADRAE